MFGTDEIPLVQYKIDTQKLFSLFPFHHFLGDFHKVISSNETQFWDDTVGPVLKTRFLPT